MAVIFCEVSINKNYVRSYPDDSETSWELVHFTSGARAEDYSLLATYRDEKSAMDTVADIVHAYCDGQKVFYVE